MATDQHAWTAWLGPAASELTDEQRERFEREAAAAGDRIGWDHDLAAERDVAWSTIVQYILGELDIDAAGVERAVSAERARHASLAAQQVAVLAVADGMSEVEAARRSSLDRATVRKVLGK